MRVESLSIYPVKSLRGHQVPHAEIAPWGIVGDRRWGVVDAAGDPVTARQVHALLGIRAEHRPADGGVRLQASGLGSLEVLPPSHGPLLDVGFSRLPQARGCGAQVDAWVSEAAGERLRLVWQDDPSARTVSSRHGGRPGDVLNLADAGPILLTSNASLEQLQDWVGASGPEISMTRFRPNVVVDGTEPFAEDLWEQIEIGDVVLRRASLCDRCVMTTIDPETLETGHEPVKTLAKHRRWGGATWFGIRMVPVVTGPIERNAEVIVVDAAGSTR
ncbi:MAG: MOSC domain-containing protein [Nocardioidaceae bacterium]|nr:MOSC domain-containing protein [Nocardioidaceae bacterium]